MYSSLVSLLPSLSFLGQSLHIDLLVVWYTMTGWHTRVRRLHRYPFSLACHALLMSFSPTPLLVRGLEVINLIKEDQATQPVLVYTAAMAFT